MGRRELIERLLADAGFRDEFRRDPGGVARRLGIDDALFASGTDPLETLGVRESRSSLAGVMLAAAVEGVALSGFPDDAAAAMPANRNVVLDADGLADMRSGRMDPRIVHVLDRISREHRITISATMSDHPRMTTGGTVSNHAHGRAVDISMVDGRPVGPDNEAAMKLAHALRELDPAIRPTEIGTPWAIDDPAFFTDADHQDHLHVGFDDPISPAVRRLARKRRRGDRGRGRRRGSRRGRLRR